MSNRKIFILVVTILVSGIRLKRRARWMIVSSGQKANSSCWRQAPKIFALSSGNLHKYEYSTGEDLNYKASTVDQAKFDYSPMSKFLNKGLKEEDKTEDKNEQQLKAIKNKAENIKKVADFVEEP